MIVDFAIENKREIIPQPPFFGVRKVTAISLKAIMPYVNKNILYKQRWRLLPEHHDDAELVLLRLLETSLQQQIIQPQAIYGYFACQSEADDLIIYANENSAEEICRFNFPRQKSGKHLCLADFFTAKQTGLRDVIALQVVTIGQKAANFERQIFAEDQYKDSFYWHGFNAEVTNALAEWVHKLIRMELNFVAFEPATITGLFKQQYRGARYSLGYAACPNLADQSKILTLLDAERIGVKLSETKQLWPEYSTTAFIVHHPRAQYFIV